MKDCRGHPRKLLVEGGTDKEVIPYLMEANGVEWPDHPHYPVCISPCGSVDEILKPGVIESELRASKLEALGVVVDANGDPVARWEQVRDCCGIEFPDLPDRIPAGGLQMVHSGGPRFGVWIMPDNRDKGMIEDLLVKLIPEGAHDLYELVRNCVAKSRDCGSPFREVHRTKAEVYTWLAWQDPPGLRIHDAVKHAVLKPTAAQSRPFVEWFKTLFGV